MGVFVMVTRKLLLSFLLTMGIVGISQLHADWAATNAASPGYNATAAPVNNLAQFPVFAWQLPAAGQGIINLTATPAQGACLHDINIMFSSSAGISPTDTDNFWAAIATSLNTTGQGTQSIVQNGYKAKISSYYYSASSPNGSSTNTPTTTPALPNSANGTNAKCDLRIIIDAPNNFFQISARPTPQTGATPAPYTTLCTYQRSSQNANFAIPTNAQYFALSCLGNPINFTSITVTPLTIQPTSCTPNTYSPTGTNNGNAQFTQWNSSWQLPSPGQGTVTFTVSPTNATNTTPGIVHDVHMMFSPSQSIATRSSKSPSTSS